MSSMTELDDDLHTSTVCSICNDKVNQKQMTEVDGTEMCVGCKYRNSTQENKESSSKEQTVKEGDNLMDSLNKKYTTVSGSYK